MTGRWIPVACLLAGGLLVAYSVASGGAHLLLFFVIPVITGGSLAFVGGVVLLLVGILTLPLAFEAAVVSSADRKSGWADGGGSGGVILLGPIPVLFGDARTISRRSYWLLVVVGVALFALTLVLFFLF
jgi:uncharacterized membrane protein